MPEFRFRYVKRSTGRPNRGTVRAFDEVELRDILAGREDVAEVLEVEALPATEASERQLAYLRELSVPVHGSLSLREASDLIDNAHSKRQPADDADRMLAARFRVETTRFTSKAAIFERILAVVAGDPVRLSRYFVYRVYRDGLGSERGSAIDDPDAAVFEEVAKVLRADASVMKSLRRAASDSRTSFRWFGDLVGSDGVLLDGDSESTTAYRAAVAELRNRGLYSARRREASDRRAGLPKGVRMSDRQPNVAPAQARPIAPQDAPVPVAAPHRGEFPPWLWWVAGIVLLGFLVW